VLIILSGQELEYYGYRGKGVPTWFIIGLGYMCFLCGYQFIMAATTNSMISPNSNSLIFL
jgi:hypothetical protein